VDVPALWQDLGSCGSAVFVGSNPGAAFPNPSRNGEPIRFRLLLDKPASVELFLFNLTGEKIYETTLPGNAGPNDYLWLLKNQQGFPVASGLYLYVFQVRDGNETRVYKGKISIIH
jgi:hypothetical protein